MHSKNPKLFVELLLREAPEPMLDMVNFGISGGTQESSGQLQDRDINRAVAIILLKLRAHFPVKRFHAKAMKTNSLVKTVLNARKNAGDGQTGLLGLGVLHGVAAEEHCHRFLHLFRPLTNDAKALEVNIGCLEQITVTLGGEEVSDSTRLENIIQKIATKAGWKLADYKFDHPPAPEASSSESKPSVPTSGVAKESIRADLRAKLTRAQELHARDECKEAIALLEEVYHAARAHGLKQEQLESVLNLAFATSERRDFKAVERKLTEAEKLIRDVKGAWHQIQYCRLKAIVLLHNKYPVPAEKLLKKAIALIEPGNHDVEVIGLLAHADYVHLLCEMKRADEADGHITRLKQIVEAPKDHHPVALLADLIEACLHWAIAKGDKEQTNGLVKIAIERGSGKEAALCLSHALNNCANGARGMKATDSALVCAEAAERLGHVAQRPVTALVAAYTAAAVLWEKKDFHAVRERCVRLLDSARALAEPKLRCCLLNLLSLASRQLGDKTTAVEAAETALRDSEGDSTCLCLAKLALAKALHDCGRVKEAMEQARAALHISEHAEMPPEWMDEPLAVLADCAARLGDWATAENFASQLGKHSSAGVGNRRKMVESIQLHKSQRETLTSVINATAPLTVARTEGASSVQAANAMLVKGIIDGWREYPNAAPAIYDYWGRGNLLRAMLNMRAFPSAFNMTLEVHTVEEARQAIRLWGLIADVLVLIWKGPTVSSGVFCPVPPSFPQAGGGGYMAFEIMARPPIPSEETGLTDWKNLSQAPWKRMSAPNVATFAIGTPHASLFPSEVGRFLCEEAVHWVSSGRLILVPATGIGCVGSGHGPAESLFAEACNAIPGIRGDAARFPASWLPYFPDIPLNALAHVVQEYDESLRRLRLLLIRKTRQFRSSGITGTEAKELELEIQDSLAQITDAQAGLRSKHGWGEAQEAVVTRYDGFTEQDVAPILVLQSMGYRWRVEPAVGEFAPEKEVMPKRGEPILTWLASPPDSRPKIITPDELREKKRKQK